MTPARRRLVNRLLDDLLDLSEIERTDELERLLVRAPRLGGWLARLLQASEEITEMPGESTLRRLARRALDDRESEPILPPGTRLGPWRLIEPVGQGGMGTVYRAERADGAFEMQAAVKLIRMRGRPQLVERLAAERRLLARLDHPGIARILDGGSSEEGRAYLAMEWVAGTDLADWHRQGHDHELFSVFRQIAQAVGHAHRNLIVHGDIKPANLRLTDDGQVKLLDFGVARLQEQDESDEGPRALTPAFAAPEQQRGELASVQSDIYSLGVLLRWLLTGSTEDRGNWRTPGVRRHADLEAIIARATDPEPGLRYRSVPELIDELDALQSDYPVLARPIGALARLRLWMRRHRLAASMGLAAMAVLSAAAATIVIQASLVAAERDLARLEAQRANAMRDHLVLMFREAARDIDDPDITARDLLQETMRQAESVFPEDPESRGQVLAMVGQLMIALHDYASARPLLESYLNIVDGDQSPALTAEVFQDLAQTLERQGEFDQALEYSNRALDLLATIPGDTAERESGIRQIRGRILRSQGQWSPAIRELELAVALADRDGKPTHQAAWAHGNLGTSLLMAGRPAQSRHHLAQALQLWETLGLGDFSDALVVRGNLASVLHQQGLLGEAEPLYREVIADRERRFGPSGALAAAYINLANLLGERGQYDEALDLVETGLALLARFEGNSGVNYARTRLVKARLLDLAGEHRVAEQTLDAGLAQVEELLGPDHLFSRIGKLSRTEMLARTDPQAASQELEQAATYFEQAGAPGMRPLARAVCLHAQLMVDLDRPDQALASVRRCLEERLEIYPEHAWPLAEAQAITAVVEHQLGHREALNRLPDELDRIADEVGRNHPTVRWLADYLSAQNSQRNPKNSE